MRACSLWNSISLESWCIWLYSLYKWSPFIPCHSISCIKLDIPNHDGHILQLKLVLYSWYLWECHPYDGNCGDGICRSIVALCYPRPEGWPMTWDRKVVPRWQHAIATSCVLIIISTVINRSTYPSHPPHPILSYLHNNLNHNEKFLSHLSYLSNI